MSKPLTPFQLIGGGVKRVISGAKNKAKKAVKRYRDREDKRLKYKVQRNMKILERAGMSLEDYENLNK